jgi:hypothetical protein
VRTDLALVDQTLLVGVDELDGVLDGDDVIGPGVVDVVDHRRQRGGLTRAGGSGDENQTLGKSAQLQDRRG